MISCLDGERIKQGAAEHWLRYAGRRNTWLKEKTDADWVYAYDAWSVPLAA